MRRNHPLLRLREGASREQHVEENLWLSLPPLEHPTWETVPGEDHTRRDEMELLYERCAGFDVHKKDVKVCLKMPGADGRPSKALRTYATKTADILELRDWLKAQG